MTLLCIHPDPVFLLARGERIVALLPGSSVCLEQACIAITRCTVADLSLWFDSPMFWAP